MCSRGVWQLHSLVVTYCPTGGSSRGVREAVRTALPAFAAVNPQLTVKVTPVPNQHPEMTGFYLDPHKPKTVALRKDAPDVVLEKAQMLVDRLGTRDMYYKKEKLTEHPSVQGYWTHGVADAAPRYGVEEIRSSDSSR